MKEFTEKLKLIYKPFLIILICVVAGYTFLNWILFKKLQLFSVNENIINGVIPICLPWVPILIWLRPRVRLLNLKSERGNKPFLYMFLAWIAIMAPTLVAQAYLETASGKLTELDNINQIDKQEATKFYKLKNFYIDKHRIGSQTVFNVSGKHNEYFNMDLFVTLPIFASSADTLNATPIAWYGLKFNDQMSNHDEQQEKEEEYQRFLKRSQSEFDYKNVNEFIYFDRIGNIDDHKEYNIAIKNNKIYSSKSTTVLIPINEPFEARNGNKFAWIFGAFGIGAFVWFLMVFFADFDKEALQRFKHGKIEKETDVKEVLSFFIPREGFYITPIIIDLNVLIFIVMVFSGLGFISFKASDLLVWGANFRPATTSGEWWRLLTNTFLHGGLMHLFANMVGLLFVGIFLEPRLGKTKYAIVYLVTGILASVASLWWHDATVSVGASGAIFGLYGVFLALLLTNIFPKSFSKTFLISTLVFIGYNLLIGLTGGIDNAAHIGGLISGFIVGLILYPQLKRDGIEVSVEPIAEETATSEQ